MRASLDGTRSGEAVSGIMFEHVSVFWEELLGLGREGSDLPFRQMAWRAAMVFLLAVVLARLGARRFMSHSAGFDMMVAVVLGSVLSRAINGDARFFPTLGASGLLLLLHHLLATLALRSHPFSQLVKGRPLVLVRNGVVDPAAMVKAKITPDDLEASLRLNGNLCRIEDVAEARLERSGAISVVRRSAIEPDQGAPENRGRE